MTDDAPTRPSLKRSAYFQAARELGSRSRHRQFSVAGVSTFLAHLINIPIAFITLLSPIVLNSNCQQISQITPKHLANFRKTQNQIVTEKSESFHPR